MNICGDIDRPPLADGLDASTAVAAVVPRLGPCGGPGGLPGGMPGGPTWPPPGNAAAAPAAAGLRAKNCWGASMSQRSQNQLMIAGIDSGCPAAAAMGAK